MRRLIVALLLAGLFSMTSQSLAGDTGTYRILSYMVGLTPHSDGTVAIEYYQKWLVTGGHIPWITVGTPNSNFTIADSRGAVARIAPASQGGWAGVRIDLDGDYRSGQTFEVGFSIIQRGVFHASKEYYELDLTPGWYDRAVTDTLRVRVKFFASIETVSADPQPSLVSGDEMVWNRYGLGQGERLSIRVSFPIGLFPAGIAKGNLKRASGASDSTPGAIAAFVTIAIVIFIVGMTLRSRKRRYSGGHVFYGGMFGGRPGGGISGGDRSTGGGGGFGGASMSCACACVSCACACACAGGGGAGCSRKLEHTCPVCGTRNGL